MPPLTAGVDRWGAAAFAAIRGEPVDVLFDRPRGEVWRQGPVNDASTPH